MKSHTLIVASALVATAFLAAPAFAQADPFADPYTVKFNLTVNQPTLFDENAHDTFKGSIEDALGMVTLIWECSAGQKGFLGVGRADEKCAVQTCSVGIIKNPANPSQTLKRIDYLGGFTIEAKKDGFTDASTIQAVYGQQGGAATSSFGGSIIMMPENPTADMLEFAGRLLEKAKDKIGGESVDFNDQVDSMNFNDFTIPHAGQRAGLPGSVPCTWSGTNLFLYATNSWQAEFDVKCGDKSLKLNGNISLVDATSGDHEQEYQINLIVGEANSDPFAAADPFAVVPGITGVLRMDNSGRESDGVFETVKVEGEIVGNGVPPEAVRGLGEILLTFPRTFFGA